MNHEILHNRSNSLTDWQNRQKMYYNYNNKQHKYNQMRNQPLGEMPTFGNGTQQRFASPNPHTSAYKKQINYSLEQQNKNSKSHHFDYFLSSTHKEKSVQMKPSQFNNYMYRLKQHDKASINSQKHKEFHYQGYTNLQSPFQATTEQKISNINKINDKIKKILNTLNQQEKKISQYHLKGGKRKIQNSNMLRVRTQGDQQYYDTNIYQKMNGLRSKFNQSFKQIQNTNVMCELNHNAYKSITIQNKRQSSQNKNRQISSHYDQEYQKRQRKPLNYLSYQRLNGRLQSEGDVSKNSVHHRSINSTNLAKSIYIKKQNETQKQNSQFFTKIQPQQARKNNYKSKQFCNNKKNQSFYSKTQNQQNLQNLHKQNLKQTQKLFSYHSRQRYTFGSIQNQESKENSCNKNSSFQVKTPIRQKSRGSLQKLQKSCKLSNGKDLDAQIQRIQRKIEHVQKQKRSLNIQFTLDTKKPKQICQNKNINKNSVQRSIQKEKHYKPQQIDKQNTHSIPLSNDRNLQISRNNLIMTNKLSQTQQNLFKNNECSNYQQIQINLPKPFKMSSKRNSKRAVGNSQVKEIQSTFISQDRSYNKSVGKNQLISKICKQIELDTKFRNSKKWFNRKPGSFKWSQLVKQLASYGIHTTDSQNNQIFTMTEQQDNPFHTQREDDCSYRQLINNFVASQKFWMSSLQHKFCRTQLQQSLQQIDIEKKGRIAIEDLVRYINLESDQYYRNRDLSLIFRRLSGAGGEVTVNYMLTQFCSLQ